MSAIQSCSFCNIMTTSASPLLNSYITPLTNLALSIWRKRCCGKMTYLLTGIGSLQYACHDIDLDSALSDKEFSGHEKTGPKSFIPLFVHLSELSPKSVLKQMGLLIQPMGNDVTPTVIDEWARLLC